MGNTFSQEPVKVRIHYKDFETEKTLPVSSPTLQGKYSFVKWVNSVLRKEGELPLEISTNVLWSESNREVCDADFSDKESFKVNNILNVYVQHSAESEAVLDKYLLEEKISETFAHMLMKETEETCQDGRPALHGAPEKSPDFNTGALQHLEETLRSAGATPEANTLAKEFQTLMSENLRKLNEVSALVHLIAEQFPAVARALKSSDSVYLSKAIQQQKSQIDSAHKAIDQARTAIASMKDKMGERMHYCEWAGGCRSSASCVGLGGSAVVPVAVGASMNFALSEGASAAAKNPFTSWMTSQKVTMQSVVKKGGWFQGSHVKVFPVITYHFHLVALVSGGCISLTSLGCLAGILYYRFRRIPRWHQLTDAYTQMMKALHTHEENWHSLCFPCDEVLVLLGQVEQEQNMNSHHAAQTWKKILKITAMLITSIDSYLVWLDMAGYVPVGFPLRSRLASASPRGTNRYDILQRKISSRALTVEEHVGGAIGQLQIEAAPCTPGDSSKLLMIENAPMDPSASADVTVIEAKRM